MLKSVKDTNTAHDLVQDCFMKLWENRKKIRVSTVKSWLFTTSYHLMINYLKKYKRNVYPEQLPQTGKYDAMRYEWKEIVEICLEMLTPEQKSVLLLYDYEGYSYKEIMEITSMTESQVKSLLFRARKKIKDNIKEQEELKVWS